MYEDDGSTNKFFVSSGSVSINEDASVQILAEEVHKVEDIDAAAAKDLVAKAAAKVSAAADEVDYYFITSERTQRPIISDRQGRSTDRVGSWRSPCCCQFIIS